MSLCNVSGVIVCGDDISVGSKEPSVSSKEGTTCT